MSKKVVRDNFRVEVYPYFGIFFEPTPEETQRRADRLEMALRKLARTDLIDDMGDVRTAWDVNEICEHCGSRWTESSKDYNGGCCAKGQDAEDERAAISSAERGK